MAKKQEKSKSEIVEDFLSLLRESESKLNYNSEELNRCDKLTADINHKFELQKLTDGQKAKLGPMQQKCQQERREYKNQVEEYEPIFNWFSTNKEAYKSLTKMLGELRKMENYHKERSYMPRVMTMEEWLS